ncbi:hypothetical protein T02_2791 [Trichinella nativa]|uniref:Uncharacterized protein n=1 Tax=Trichinella nativa TaxID=6335 RepID=A0A0V1L341_9BILA|nr:hypothetical protein T02_2791 [Trichinella nativa]
MNERNNYKRSKCDHVNRMLIAFLFFTNIGIQFHYLDLVNYSEKKSKEAFQFKKKCESVHSQREKCILFVSFF